MHTCAIHSNSEGIAICSQCEKNICVICYNANVFGYAICPKCKKVVLNTWENAPFIELPLAFFKTAKAALFAPVLFFTEIAFTSQHIQKDRQKSSYRAILFGLISMVFGVSITGVYRYYFTDLFEKMSTEAIAEAVKLYPQVEWVPDDLKLGFFLALPVIGFLGFFVHWLILHLGLKFAGADSTPALSGRITAYVSAAYLARVIPPIAEIPVGSIITVVFLVHLNLTAVRLVYNLSIMRSFLVVSMVYLFTIFFF